MNTAREGLSDLVEGELPPGTVVLVAGPPGVGKTTLSLDYLAERLQGGVPGIILSTELSPGDVLASPRVSLVFRFHLEDPGVPLHVLDLYSWRAGLASDGPRVVSVRSLADLSEISIQISRVLEQVRVASDRFVAVFDTPSTLSLHASPAAILKFLEVVFAKVKAAGGCLLVPIEAGVHDPQFMAALSYMCDGFLEMRLDEEDDELVRYARVRSMRTVANYSTRWVRLSMEQEGAQAVTVG